MSKRALFIDRDGTLIVEPPTDFQVDSFEKLTFVPGAITSMSRIAGLDYELVMASNQDGLGTESFPEEAFRPVHDLVMRTFEGEGVRFDDVLIDPTMPEEHAPTRKPGIGMFGRYTGGDYDLSACYVIGDRPTDMLLAATSEREASSSARRQKAGKRSAKTGSTTSARWSRTTGTKYGPTCGPESARPKSAARPARPTSASSSIWTDRVPAASTRD